LQRVPTVYDDLDREAVGDDRSRRRPAVDIPSMISPEERRDLFWLARHHYTGRGAILDAGPLLNPRRPCWRRGSRSPERYRRHCSSAITSIFSGGPRIVGRHAHASPRTTDRRRAPHTRRRREARGERNAAHGARCGIETAALSLGRWTSRTKCSTDTTRVRRIGRAIRRSPWSGRVTRRDVCRGRRLGRRRRGVAPLFRLAWS
jgi:hypothetical protein